MIASYSSIRVLLFLSSLHAVDFFLAEPRPVPNLRLKGPPLTFPAITMESTPQFHNFPLLPSELRLKIWSLALCTPRTVTISCRKSPFHHRTPEIPRIVESFSTSAAVPALLHANRESRHEALAFYSASFETPRSRIFLSFAYDSVRMSDNILVNVPEPARMSIRHMVLDVRDCDYFEYFNMECLRGMRALETLELLVARDAVVYNWGSRGRYAERLVEDFETTRREHPEWDCPDVRIVNKESLEQEAFMEGGPGVYPPDLDNEE